MHILHHNLFIRMSTDSEFDKYTDLIPPGYTIYGRLDGIIQKLGKSAGLEANWCFEALDDDGNECLLMYCNPGVFSDPDNIVIQKWTTSKSSKLNQAKNYIAILDKMLEYSNA